MACRGHASRQESGYVTVCVLLPVPSIAASLFILVVALLTQTRDQLRCGASATIQSGTARRFTPGAHLCTDELFVVRPPSPGHSRPVPQRHGQTQSTRAQSACPAWLPCQNGAVLLRTAAYTCSSSPPQTRRRPCQGGPPLACGPRKRSREGRLVGASPHLPQCRAAHLAAF